MGKTFQIAAIIVAVALVGTVAVIATNGDSDGQAGDFLRRLHGLGSQIHGGHHHEHHMAELIEQLELTPDQRERLERVHEMAGSLHGGGRESMFELHEELMTQFERGHVETDEIRQVIDGHVEQIRETAYAATDELVALVNGLDGRQRAIVLEHVQAFKESHPGHGP